MSTYDIIAELLKITKNQSQGKLIIINFVRFCSIFLGK